MEIVFLVWKAGALVLVAQHTLAIPALPGQQEECGQVNDRIAGEPVA